MADRLANMPRPPHKPMPRGLVVLVAVIALIEIVLSLGDAGIVFGPSLRTGAYILGAFWTALLHDAAPLYPGQTVAMFITHALLHGSLLHMVMNMTILLALGRFTSDRYGPGVVLPVFFLGAIAGAGTYGLLATSESPMVGASGAVFAFLGVWIAWDWRRHRARGMSPAPVARRVLVLAGLNLLTFIGLQGYLAWEAHLGGFLAGLACGAWFEARMTRVALAERAEERRRRAESEAPGE